MKDETAKRGSIYYSPDQEEMVAAILKALDVTFTSEEVEKDRQKSAMMVVFRHYSTRTKRQLEKSFPGLSQVEVEETLEALIREGRVKKIGKKYIVCNP